jgi:replicative DNA helicase
MIIDQDIIPEVLSTISSDYFYNDQNRDIYKSIAFLYSKKMAIDLVTIKEQLDKF